MDFAASRDQPRPRLFGTRSALAETAQGNVDKPNLTKGRNGFLASGTSGETARRNTPTRRRPGFCPHAFSRNHETIFDANGKKSISPIMFETCFLCLP